MNDWFTKHLFSLCMGCSSECILVLCSLLVGYLHPLHHPACPRQTLPGPQLWQGGHHGQRRHLKTHPSQTTQPIAYWNQVVPVNLWGWKNLDVNGLNLEAQSRRQNWFCLCIVSHVHDYERFILSSILLILPKYSFYVFVLDCHFYPHFCLLLAFELNFTKITQFIIFSWGCQFSNSFSY